MTEQMAPHPAAPTAPVPTAPAPVPTAPAPVQSHMPPVDKSVTQESASPTSVIPPNATMKSPPSPTAAAAPPDGHHAHAAVATHPENAHVKTVDAPPSPASSKASLSSSMRTEGGGGSMDRDAALAKVQQDKTLSHIRAWEESCKAKANNRCEAELSKIAAWENSKKAAAEAQLRQAEEKLEKKRAALVEKMQNRIAAAHKKAEERRSIAEAKRGEEHVKADEAAAKYKATGKQPGGFLCFKA